MLYRTLVKPCCRRKRSSVSGRKGALRKVKQLVLLLLNAEIKAGVASWLCNQMVHVSYSGDEPSLGEKQTILCRKRGEGSSWAVTIPCCAELGAPSTFTFALGQRSAAAALLGVGLRAPAAAGTGTWAAPGGHGCPVCPGAEREAG